MAHDFTGRTVIVTGAARGQGAAAEVALLVASGAFVVATDVLDEEGEKSVVDHAASAVYRHPDVSSEGDWADLVGYAVRRSQS